MQDAQRDDGVWWNYWRCIGNEFAKGAKYESGGCSCTVGTMYRRDATYMYTYVHRTDTFCTKELGFGHWTECIEFVPDMYVHPFYVHVLQVYTQIRGLNEGLFWFCIFWPPFSKRVVMKPSLGLDRLFILLTACLFHVDWTHHPIRRRECGTRPPNINLIWWLHKQINLVRWSR